MGDRVVAQPDALDDHVRAVRARVLAVDASSYHTAMTRFAHAGPNDIGDGDVYALTSTIMHALQEVARGNWAADLFAGDLRALDRTRGRNPTRTTLDRMEFAQFLGRVTGLPGTQLLSGDHARIAAVVGDLRADLATAGDPASGHGDRAAADRRLAAHLAALLAAGIDDDPRLQAVVVDLLGPAWLAEFAAHGARHEVADGRPVPWVRASMQVLADWTATHVRGLSPGQQATFMAAMPADLVIALATHADWGPDAGAAAAMHAWDVVGVARLERVVPPSLVSHGWPQPSSTREAVAAMLAGDPAAAHRTLTARGDILNWLLTSIDHPSGQRAIVAGLVDHPEVLLESTGDATALQASAAAVARLGAAVPAIGARSLTSHGRAALEAVVRFHLGKVAAGVRASADVVLADATGTHGWMLDQVLAHELSQQPDTVRAMAGRLTATEVGMLVDRLAGDGLHATAATVVVGEVVGGRLAATADDHHLAMVVELGPQALAELTAAAVEVGDLAVLRGLGRAFAAGVSAMQWQDQVDWLGMLAAANDRAGWASALLAGSDGLPGSMLPTMLGLESPTFLLPSSPVVRGVLDDLAGDWTIWSATLYERMFADHPAGLDLLLGMAAARHPDRAREHLDADAGRVVAGRLATGSVSAGLAHGIEQAVARQPQGVVERLEGADRGHEAAFVELAALVELTQPAGGAQGLVDSVAEHALADAFTRSAVPLATGRADRDELDALRGRFQHAGELIGQLEAFARPRGFTFDVLAISRVVLVRLLETVPVVGTIAGIVEDEVTLVEAVDLHVPNLGAIASEERASIFDAMDFLSSSTATRSQLLGDFGFTLDANGAVADMPDLDVHDPRTVLDAHPEYLPFFLAAESLADGLQAGRALLDDQDD